MQGRTARTLGLTQPCGFCCSLQRLRIRRHSSCYPNAWHTCVSASKRSGVNENYELLQTAAESTSDDWFRHIVEDELTVPSSSPTPAPQSTDNDSGTENNTILPAANLVVDASAPRGIPAPGSGLKQNGWSDEGWGVEESIPDWYTDSQTTSTSKGFTSTSDSTYDYPPADVANEYMPNSMPSEPASEEYQQFNSPLNVKSLTILTRTDMESVFPLLPSKAQVAFYQPRSVQERIIQVFGSVGATVVLSKMAALAAPALLYPIWGPYIRAGVRNVQVYGQSFNHVALWRTQILGVELLGIPQLGMTAARVAIGDPWQGGGRTVMEFSAAPGAELLFVGDVVELLVTCDNEEFSTFKVIKELYIPRLDMWLCEYPLMNRPAFTRISDALYAMEQQQEQPGMYASAGEQPGMYASAGEQPGMYASAGEQPGMYAGAGEQPGVYGRGGEQPGTYDVGAQPGMYSSNVEQPGMYGSSDEQPGLYGSQQQPGMYRTTEQPVKQPPPWQ